MDGLDKPRRVRAAVVCGVLALSCVWPAGGCRSTPPPPRVPLPRFLGLPPDLPEGAFKAVEAFPGVRFDWAVRAVYERTSNRYFVIEREGRVWSFPNIEDTRDKTLVLDLSQRTQGYYDCGLLGLAFHPAYGQRGARHSDEVFLWYNYSERPQGSRAQRPRYRTPSFNRLARFSLPPGAATIDPRSEVVLIDQYNETTFHDGGAMFFHPDEGLLYLTLGDDFNTDNAQRVDRGLFAGVVRIDVDADTRRSHPIRRRPRNGLTRHYGIPNDNPFVSPQGSTLEEFWALGLRSPHSMSLDRPTGRILLADVGHMQREELNLLKRGANYEWPHFEGTSGQEPPAPLLGRRQAPLIDYPHAEGDNCIIGGLVYRGRAHAELSGRVLLGDNGSNRVWALELEGERPGARRQIARLPGPGGYVAGLSSFAEDAAGEPLLVRVGAQSALWRLVPQPRDRAAVPALLSQTGIFSDVKTLTPAPGVLPYAVAVPRWLDGARARRFLAVPEDGDGRSDPQREQLAAAPDGEWRTPKGSVAVMHVELPLDARAPAGRTRPLETRVLVHSRRGEHYALTYLWRADGSDAELVPRDRQPEIEIDVVGPDGAPQKVAWNVPSRAQCRQCHSPEAGGVLGLRTRQLAVPAPGAGGATVIEAWVAAGLLPKTARLPPPAQRLAALDDESRPLEERVRSYLDTNCSACHRPGLLARAQFDARYTTPLAQAGIVDGEVLEALGMQGARVVKRGDPGASLLLLRLHASGAIAMPPVGRSRADTQALAAVSRWIEGLAGGAVGGN